MADLSEAHVHGDRGTVGTTLDATIFGGHLTDATAVNVAGTGVSATILSGRTDTELPVRVSIATDRRWCVPKWPLYDRDFRPGDGDLDVYRFAD